MNCLFCHQQLSDPTCSWSDAEGVNSKTAIVLQEFECLDCQCSFTQIESSKELVNYSIETDDYRAVFMLWSKTFYLEEITHLNNFGPTDKHYKIILTVDSLPTNLTPQNINQKIKTMLVFS